MRNWRHRLWIAGNIGWKHSAKISLLFLSDIVEIYEKTRRAMDERIYVQPACAVVANYKVRCRLSVDSWRCRCWSDVVVCCCCRANRLRRARSSRWNTLPRLSLCCGDANCCWSSAAGRGCCCWRCTVAGVMTSSAALRSILSSICAISRSRRSILLHTSVDETIGRDQKVYAHALDFTGVWWFSEREWNWAERYARSENSYSS